MSNELVSIITPSYNTGAYIAETIKSVIAQTYTNWEMIIVDDCSTDNTDIVVAQFADPRIKYLKNAKNSGTAVSRNYALREAKGKWIAFLDSDDLWLPEKLEKQIAFMEKHKCSFSYTNYELVDEKSNLMHIEISGPNKIGKTLMYAYNWLGCLTVMYDAKLIGTIQIEDLKKRNDYAIWIKVINKAECRKLNENTALYRKRSGSLSNTGYLKLVKHHYFLWRYGAKFNCISAASLTLINLLFGVLKKVFYIKKYRIS